MVPKDVKSRIEEFVKILNQHDLQTFQACYAKDCIVVDPSYPDPLKGSDAVRKDFEKVLRNFPDMKYSLEGFTVSGDTSAVELIATGSIRGPARATKPTMELRIAAFSRINNQGLITEERRYYDVAGIMQQLGRKAA